MIKQKKSRKNTAPVCGVISTVLYLNGNSHQSTVQRKTGSPALFWFQRVLIYFQI